MDIDLLSKMIKELVLEHDRVSLPGLGVFIAEMMPASFTDKGYTITPPYRRLSFRPGQEDDRLLVSMYASVNDVGEGVAMAALSDFIAGMKDILERKKAIVFPGLGRMRATRENNFFFVSDEDLDIYPEGVGLEPVSLKTHEETREEVSTALGSLEAIIGRTDDISVAAEEVVPEKEIPDGPDETETPVLDPEPLGEEAGSEDGAGIPGGDNEDEQIRELKEMPVLVSQEENGPAPEENIPGPEVRTSGNARIRVLYVVLAVLAAAVLLLVLYMVAARIFPGALDGLLYNKEDYEILHNISQFKN